LFAPLFLGVAVHASDLRPTIPLSQMNEQDLAPYFRTHVDDRRTRRGTQVAATALLATLSGTGLTTRRGFEIAFAIDAAMLALATVAALAYLRGTTQRSVGVLITASLITLWTASGVMVSWMEGFCNAYHMQRSWGVLKERLIALLLVIASFIPMTVATILVAFGNQVEDWMVSHLVTELGPVILLLWTLGRWLISMLTSIAVLALIYHFGLPRWQQWYRVLPGATLATVVISSPGRSGARNSARRSSNCRIASADSTTS